MAGIAFLCLIGMACAEAVPPSRGTPTPPPYTGTWGLTAGWGPHGEVSPSAVTASLSDSSRDRSAGPPRATATAETSRSVEIPSVSRMA